jgi:16S rRNA (cytosine1402-N4)-methyltransferase
VLLSETIALLDPQANQLFLDGTLGGGGHTAALLARGARVIGVDRDERALSAAQKRLSEFAGQFELQCNSFSQALAEQKAPLDGVLLDLGVSSPQLDVASRGFSFMSNGPLDMRMGSEGETAAALVKNLTEEALANAIYEFGEERFSRQIARVLKETNPETTFELADAVKRAIPKRFWPKDTHVATRTFQGLRIAVNRELEQLQQALNHIPNVLKPSGRIAIISFHSLEDRLVKQSFKALCGEAPDDLPRGFPVISTQIKRFSALTRKPVTASAEELSRNPRARSAKLRAVQKIEIEKAAEMTS